MAWSDKEKPEYKFNGNFEIGVHIRGDPGSIRNIGNDGLVNICTAGSLNGVQVILQTARAYRDGLLGRNIEAYLRSPNQQICDMYSDIAKQEKPIQKL